ncbi:MAG: 50S ribosomal protein L1 [Dehalococcoidales bacterium]|nr:50S ribosomal protein L1 [Dehalococcoidales bacterium]
MPKHGKKYQEALKLIDRTRYYSPEEAIALAKQAAHAGYDETVELHLKMGLDPHNAQQQVRGVTLLPFGLGKEVRVLVFAQGEAAKIAEEAGADYVGSDELVKKIEEGWIEFETAIATQDMMSKVGKLGKVLGRRGLMPNPKSGTVVPPTDIARAVGDSRKGRVEFRLDRTGIIHLPLGKISFDDRKLVENLSAVIDAIVKAKPSGAKGQYVKSATIATSIGPGIKLDLRTTLTLTPS